MARKKFYTTLSLLERTTFQILIVSTICNGFYACQNQITDIIARKSLSAADWQLTLLTMIWPVSSFLSIYWGRILEKSENKAPFFIIGSLLGRLTLIFGFWITNMNQYLVMLSFVYFFNSLIIPAQNSIYQNNICADKRGKIFGINASIATLIGMLLSYPAGKILDINSENYRYIFLISAIFSFMGSFILAFAPKKEKIVKSTKEKKRKETITEILLSPINRTYKLLKKNREFARFQMNYTLYGMGFISMAPVIPIFMVDHLKLSFTTSFLAKAIISQVGMFLLSPVFGMIHDKLHPHKFTFYAFGIFTMFPGFFLLSAFALSYSETLAVIFLFLAYLVFGVGMSGINVSWNMSSIYFAGKEDASMYQSVHVTFTGVRGLLAPLMSLVMLRFFGIKAVFFISILFLIAASLSSFKGFLVCKKMRI